MKRLLSALLAVCMIIAIAPPVSLAKAAETVTYVFNYDSLGAGKDVTNVYADYTATGNTWKFEAANSCSSIKTYRFTRELEEGTIVSGDSFAIQIASTKVGAWAAVRIKVPEAGEYNASLTSGQNSTNGGYGDVYLLPGSTTTEENIAEKITGTPLNGATPINYNYSETYKKDHGGDVTDFGEVTIASGETEYILVFKVTGAGTNNKYNMFPQSFTLTPVEGGDSGEQPGGGDDEIPAEEGYTFTYDLNPKKYSGKSGEQSAIADVYAEYEDTYNMWKWGELSSGNGTVVTYQYSRVWNGTATEQSGETLYGILANAKAPGAWIALKISTPVAGSYTAKLTYGKHAHTKNASNGGKGSVYILPGSADVETALASATALNKNLIDYSWEEKENAFGGNVYECENNAEITEVESWLVFNVSEAGCGGGYRMYPQSITLTNGDGEKTKTTAIYAEVSDEVTVGDSAVLNVYSYLSNGTVKKLSPAEMTFTPSPEASVDSGGKITGVSEGEATVKCSAVIDEEEHKCEVSFTVGPKKLPVIIEADAYAYDFNEGFNAGLDVTDVATEYGTVNDRGLWKYHTKSAGTIKTHKWGFEINPGKADAWSAIKINVPNIERPYYVSLEHGQSSTNGGYGDIYILPGNTDDIAAAIESAEPVIENISYYNSKQNIELAYTSAESAVKLSGEHIVVFVAREKGKTDGGFRMYPGKLTIDSTNILRFVDIISEKTEYSINPNGTRDEGAATVTARLLDGTELPEDEIEIIYGSDDMDIATFADGIITARGHGETTVFATVKYNGVSVTKEQRVVVTDNSGIDSAVVLADGVVFAGEEIKLSSVIKFKSGNELRIPDAIYEITDGEAELLDGGILRSDIAGEVTVKGSFAFEGSTVETEPLTLTLRERTTKTESTYYTVERVAAARENVKKYEWAKESYEETKILADRYLTTYERLYEIIPSEGLPRSNRVGAEGDPDYSCCRYCGVDITVKYGSRGANAYDTDVVNRPWKVQCPDCKRLFPSNDFDKFYELGLDREGRFDRLRALRAHRAMLIEKGLIADNGETEPTDSYNVGYHGEDWYRYYGYGVEGGYLYNKTYEELWKDSTKETYNKDPRTGDEIEGIRWGVDDGFGYLPGRVCAKDSANADIYERHAYIAYYVHDLWKTISYNIIRFAEMYAYTGDERYGSAGAIILDRVADLYPTFSYKQWDNMYLVAHGGSGYGKIFGRINDCTYATNWSRSADAFWDAYDNPEVVSFLSQKAEKYGYANSKTSREKIWANIEEGLLLEIFEAAKRGEIFGNYGQQQQALSSVALVLAREPKSKEIMDWIYQPGAWTQNNSTKTAKCTGGNLSVQLVDVVDRNGIGNEAAPNYNTSWIEYMIGCADTMKMYSEDEKYNLYLNPKFGKMFTAHIPLALVNTHTAQIGDSGQTASVNFMDSDTMLTKGMQNFKDTPLGPALAEYIYRRNGNTTDGLHYDIWTKDPEQMRSDIEKLLGEEKKQTGIMLSGYGFAVLRDGGAYGDRSTPTYTNTMRDFWVYFGRNGGHGHLDTLNLGIEAFGLNFAPDMGYPQVATTEPHRYQWMEATISHNTVTVNEEVQKDSGVGGTPLHFDETDEVKIMDVDAPQVYPDTSIYRRTVVMINVGDDVSYGIDFFRVKGGDDHIYSFHSQSDEIYGTEGLDNIVKQVDEEGNYIGTYAGTTYVDPVTGETKPLEYGADPCGSYDPDLYYVQHGFTWLRNIRRAADVEDFAVDFKVTDFRKVLKDGKGLHLRMTMLNDFKLSEVALAGGSVPEKSENAPLPATFEYVLARRTGENLDSLFTTVYEPYRNTPYIAEMCAIAKENITADRAESEDSAVKAVKVVRTDSRTDYIVYATDNTVLYTITDGDVSFNFRGFVGVYSVAADENGYKCVYSYVHDGDVIGNNTYTGAYNVKISDFTRELSFNNSITVIGENIDVSRLDGKYIFVENDGVQNGAYEIEYAEETDGGAILHLADSVSPIRSYKDENDTSKGFKYNISIGQNAVIPLSNVMDGDPVFNAISDSLSVSAGSSISVPVSAYSPDGNDQSITYIGTTLPRGASLDAASGKFTWKPDKSQVGDNHVAVTARDGLSRETTVHFTVTVYGSTTGDKNGNEETPSTGGSGGSSGGGGGGAAPDAGNSSDTTAEDGGSDVPNDGDTTQSDEKDNETAPDASGETDNIRFTDLINHAWAEDSINVLADDGIIKGTTASTFSPADNITRADFASLLVRAFSLESDNAENFVDVSASDYFASELAVARNTGIVQGIGSNRYAPRNTITRQDMMVIVYRALQVLSVAVGDNSPEGQAGIEEYSDFAAVADYARDAVSTLIGAGLVNGKSGCIAPTEYTTRAEVAVLIRRILDYMK